MTNAKIELAKSIIEEIRLTGTKVLIGAFVTFYNKNGNEDVKLTSSAMELNALEIPGDLENLDRVITNYVQENLNNVEWEMKLHKEFKKVSKIGIDLQTFLNDEDGWSLQDISTEEKELHKLASKLDNYLIDYYQELTIEKEEY